MPARELRGRFRRRVSGAVSPRSAPPSASTKCRADPSSGAAPNGLRSSTSGDATAADSAAPSARVSAGADGAAAGGSIAARSNVSDRSVGVLVGPGLGLGPEWFDVVGARWRALRVSLHAGVRLDLVRLAVGVGTLRLWPMV